MERRKRFALGSLLSVAIGGALALSGSRAGADWPWFHGTRTLPPPLPLGTYVRGWQTAQAAAADADHFVIYRSEWYLGGTTLGPYGRNHLFQLAKRLKDVPFSVLIQVDTDQKLNALRHLEITNQLLALGIGDAQTRVIVGYPQAEGLYGEEAARIYSQTYSTGIGGGFGGGYGGAGMIGGSLSTGGLGTSFGSGFGGGFRGD